MTATLTPDRVEGLLAAYGRDGFIVIPGVLDEATVRGCLEHLQAASATRAHGETLVTAPLSDSCALSVSLKKVAFDDRLFAIAGAVLGSDPIPFGCTYIVKEPWRGLPVLWHQDGHPWRVGLGITSAVTLWIALDRTGPDNGGLQVIPGSHGLPAQALRPNLTEPSVFGYEIDPSLVDAHRSVQLTMAAGDISAHHPDLIHGSPPNRSDRPRRALAVRYRAA